MVADYTSGSAADRLEAVRAAIAKILNSQEYQVGNRRNRYAELKHLRDLERELEAEIASSGTTLPIRLAKLRPGSTT